MQIFLKMPRVIIEFDYLKNQSIKAYTYAVGVQVSVILESLPIFVKIY